MARLALPRWPQIGILAWAAFWAWFAVGDGLHHYRHEGDGRALAFLAASVAVLASLVAASWMLPRLGAVLLIAFGVFALWFFQGAAAVFLLALPPLVLGAFIHARHAAGAPAPYR